MRSEEPAVGILKQNDFGDSIWYHVECDCMNSNHCHTMEVEANSNTQDVEVYVYTDVTTPFWSKNRWKMIWQILTKGYASHEACIILNKQGALNYAEALKSTIKELENRQNAC